MATQPTQNPVPSEAPRDLKFNAGKIDEFVNSSEEFYQDRFGSNHYTIEGLDRLAMNAIASFGYITLDSFEKGATLTLPNEVLRFESNGQYYRWDGELPKDVPINSTPDNTGGIGIGKWLSVGGAANNIYAENYNDLKAIIPSYPNQVIYLKGYNAGSRLGGGVFISVSGTATDNGGSICVPNSSTAFYWKRQDTSKITPYMFGAYGDGTTDDGIYFSKALAAHNKLFVPKGDVFYINTPITNGATQNVYSLGGFSIDSDGAELRLGDTGNITILASGSSVNGLRLIPQAAGTGNAIVVGNLTGTAVEHFRITNNFIGNPANSATYYFANAILLRNAWYGTISANEIMNVPAYVGQFGVGIAGVSSVNISVTRNTIMSFSTGIVWSSDATVGHRCEGWMINNNIIIACTTAATLSAGLLATITNNVIDIIIGTGTAITAVIDNLVLSNNWISVAGNALTVTGDNPQINGNSFYGNMLSTGTSKKACIIVISGIEGMVIGNNARGFDSFLKGSGTSISYWVFTGNTLRDMTTGFSDLSYFPLSQYQGNIHRGSATDSAYTTPAGSFVERGKFRTAVTVSAVAATTGSFTVTIPSGVFAEAPAWGRATPINVNADYLLSYSSSESSATSAKFYIRNVSGANISAFSCQFELSGE